ncbi:MAG: alpha/beta hydrolase [Ferruginibacter sp.]|nr:alpha/beta hydrolase [Ferruginibacter sp.]
MKVYFVSGLAADRRVFKHIKLPHGYEIIHIDWIAPAKNESLEEYSSRLSEKIVPGEPFALLGLSMGGMIVSEISRQYAAKKKTKPVITILLSSVPVSRHLPKHFKLARSLRLYKFIPVKFLKSASFLNRFFSSDNKEDKAILHQVIKDSDPGFIRWAMQAVLEWKNEVLPQPLVHIHGTKDRILPARYTKPTHLIYKASHLMVMGRANEINLLLSEALLSVSRT